MNVIIKILVVCIIFFLIFYGKNIENNYKELEKEYAKVEEEIINKQMIIDSLKNNDSVYINQIVVLEVKIDSIIERQNQRNKRYESIINNISNFTVIDQQEYFSNRYK